MKKVAIITSAVLMLMGVGLAGAQESQAVVKATEGQTVKKQAVCPIEGGPVNTNLYVDANGKRVYFCCEGCPAVFKKDPAKYIAKLEKDGVTLDKAPAATNAVKHQTLCPVTGSPISPTFFVDYKGKRVYVCCGQCLAKVKKDPAKYVEQLESEGLTLDKTPAK